MAVAITFAFSVPLLIATLPVYESRRNSISGVMRSPVSGRWAVSTERLEVHQRGHLLAVIRSVAQETATNAFVSAAPVTVGSVSIIPAR